MCRISFTCLFQEIWDYKVTFNNWKGLNFINKQGEPLSTSISISLRKLNFNHK